MKICENMSGGMNLRPNFNRFLTQRGEKDPNFRKLGIFRLFLCWHLNTFKPMLWHEYKVFLGIFFGGLECVGHSFAYVATNLATHLLDLMAKRCRERIPWPCDFQLTTDRNVVHKTRQHCLCGRCEDAACLCNIGVLTTSPNWHITHTQYIGVIL